MNRIWIYQSKKAFTASEIEEISGELNEFISAWAAHKKKLNAGFEIKYGHFIILYVNQDEVLASGCSIDDSIHFMQKLDKKYDLSLFDRRQMAFVDDTGEIRICHLNDIPDLKKSGLISDQTRVFNNTILDENELSSSWKIPFKESGFAVFA